MRRECPRGRHDGILFVPFALLLLAGFSEALLRGWTILGISKASFLSSLLVARIASGLLRFIYVSVYDEDLEGLL